MFDIEPQKAEGRLLFHFKNLEVLSPTIGRQLLERGLDERDLHTTLLGEGIRVFSYPGWQPIRLRQAQGSAPVIEVDLRYHPRETVEPMNATESSCKPHRGGVRC